MIFGTFIRRKRQDMDLSQMELAKRIGVRFSRMSDIEMCRVEPTPTEKAASAKVCGWKTAGAK